MFVFQSQTAANSLLMGSYALCTAELSQTLESDWTLPLSFPAPHLIYTEYFICVTATAETYLHKDT